jgi:hypothetical protein
MTRTWGWLLLMAFAVAALGLFVYQSKRNAPEGEAHALSTLKPAEIKRIRIEVAASSPAPEGAAKSAGPQDAGAPGHAIELERTEVGWRMTAPITARADAAQIERLLGVLDARSIARYPAKDLGRYGLDRPLVALVLNDQRFALGAVNTVTQEQYVLAGDAVYAVPLAQRVAVPRNAESLLARALFAPGETPVRFELETFTASQEDGKWNFAPVGEEPGPDERNGWVAAWRQANATRVAPYDGRNPISTVTITLQDGRGLPVAVLQREPELVLLRQDERIQYHFLGDVGKRLLSPPSAKP